ncbi:MAG: peptidoglycan DD-metalloendopeptidase family protein [Candidatus Kerfeldbacteria bacterium]|nr:peptidoglycan DD-metalloendopeptidase family protein [Candidatus Kerfeldbacteria bacterium]
MLKTRSLAASLLTAVLLFTPASLGAQTIDDLNSQIKDKQQKIDEIKKQVEAYQSAIAQKQAEASTLKKQLSILDDKIAQTELDIKVKELNLNTITLQIQAVSLDIGGKERDITDKKSKIAEILRQINQTDQRSLLEIIALSSSLGQYFDQLNYLGELQRTLQKNLNEVQTIKTQLEHRQQDLNNYRSQLIKAKNDLQSAKGQLDDEQGTKQNILKQTRLSESKYQNLLAQALQEQEKANNDIKNLEQEVRRRLQKQGSNRLEQMDTNFIWPVNPYKGLSTYFHDPTYIFRRYFEHPGIDIPQPQGSSIKAAAAGYVAIAKDAGLGYSYIMIIHKDGLATVYGHVSRIDVAADNYVSKGQIIGAVGGTPGTRGAGRLTTGPHLHFEIRASGIPVNPLDYLP